MNEFRSVSRHRVCAALEITVARVRCSSEQTEFETIRVHMKTVGEMRNEGNEAHVCGCLYAVHEEVHLSVEAQILTLRTGAPFISHPAFNISLAFVVASHQTNHKQRHALNPFVIQQ